MTTIITIQQFTKAFKGVSLFESANAYFSKGKIYGLVGPNGAGKSVLLKCICQFIQPDAGEIMIHPDYKDHKQRFPTKFGIIIDRPGYIPHLTGFENLQALAKIQHKITDVEIRSAMQAVGIDVNLKQKMQNYSLGMKQKIALAQAIMEKQEVLILDEPFNGLDKKSVARIRALLLQLNKEGRTIIFTSHNQADIAYLCDDIYQIDDYKLEHYDNPSKLMQTSTLIATHSNIM